MLLIFNYGLSLNFQYHKIKEINSSTPYNKVDYIENYNIVVEKYKKIYKKYFMV